VRTTTRRDEITFRQIYTPLIQTKRVTIIFRPGRRLCEDPKGYCKGEIVTLRVVEKVGADWAGVPGILRDDVGEKVEILDVSCVPIGSLTAADFSGSTPDVIDRASLAYHLGVVYNLSPDELDEKALVTKTAFRYLS
jgi:hypothetical protein